MHRYCRQCHQDKAHCMIRVLMIIHLVLSVLVAVAHAEVPLPAIPSFKEVTKSSGVASIYSGEYLYMVGGGAATFDCNKDGYPDLFTAGGEGRASFFRNQSKRGGALKLKKQKSGLEFDKVTGAYPLDVDADGNVDLVVLRVGENKLMRGLGNCKFDLANTRWGFDGGDAWSTAFAATFEKDAVWPTIAIGNYIDPKQDISPWGSCTDNWLHRARVDQKTPPYAFAKPVALTPSYCALSMLFTDWNRTGTPSLRVSNDREYYEGGEEQMWKLVPGEPPALYTDKDGWKRLRIWGMGIASADVNGDGYPDYFLTSMADNKLQMLKEVAADGKSKADFKDVAWPSGLTLHRPTFGVELKSSTGWHAQFEDVNNDGRDDLFVAKGNVDSMPDFAMKDPNNLALGKADGSFVDVAKDAGVASTETSRGGIVVDLNLDGMLDLVVVNRRAPAQTWLNTSKAIGHWLQVRLEQETANRDGIGAWIEVKRGEVITRREITSGGGHASGHLGWWHFGLGAAEAAEVRVLWPHGEPGPWQPVVADGFYVLKAGADPKIWTPR
jgi:enediyne biosynthesis protein E4